MDTTTPDPLHPLSGLNPALCDAVVQYADMDMLRSLVLTSASLYEALQRCKFDHLSMVVLEAPILDVQQQVVYNGADPVPSSTFQLSVDDIVATPSAETASSSMRDSAFDVWKQRCSYVIGFGYDLIIPDYARNFMARAQSVELVVYRPRLGTRISAFFTNNAHLFKHGPQSAIDGCTLRVDSNCHRESADHTSQYKLHLPCLTTTASHAQHCNQKGEERHNGGTCSPSDNGCAFSKYRSHQYPNGDATESRRLFHTFPNRPAHLLDFPFDGLPSLQIKFLHDTTNMITTMVAMLHFLLLALACFAYGAGTGTVAVAVALVLVLVPIYVFSLRIPFVWALFRGVVTISTQFEIVANSDNSHASHPRFKNLPHAEQNPRTTSLNTRIVDCVSFGAEDWCNAIPGCTIQPVQTCLLHDQVGDNDNGNKNFNIADHFPHLTSLTLQHTRVDETNQCGIDEFMTTTQYGIMRLDTPLSHFFIDSDIRLSHLEHFGVVGTLLNPNDYASIAFNNASVTSLNINPGLQPSSDAYTLAWMGLLNITLDNLEHSQAKTSSVTSDDDDLGYEAAFVEYNHFGQPLQQPHHHVIAEPLETTEPKPKHKLRPHRKYNFSFDFASPCLENCCPHKTHILSQRASTNTPGNINGATYEDFTHLAQHAATCGLIYGALSKLYLADRDESENTYAWPVSESPPLTLSLPLATTAPPITLLPIASIAGLAQRTLAYLDFHCHYCSHANRGKPIIPCDSPDGCTAAGLPPSTNALNNNDLARDVADEYALPRAPGTRYEEVRNTQYSEQMYMRLRQLLQIPPHVVLRL